MKDGVIVYLVGGVEWPSGVDLHASCHRLGLKADQVALVGPPDGFFEVEEAWHHLYCQGCGRINLLVAKWEEPGLRPLRPVLRLSG